ncbi:formate acetyltransferase [Leptolyngbya sp. Heron Island J]|uniref:formate C-acetyltransferase n=1 Tax=Leptolyngbya sp. Heron Island J TaxID=1385935 RepID=UPI0003B9F79B|nr:formate C-acetyltransferase [Leptolyngbya sp. Heron Island J]ESA33570.1 formate acetyltransferase [Leptolyngbya sp. Heron Island J]
MSAVSAIKPTATAVKTEQNRHSAEFATLPAWQQFAAGSWMQEINVRDFIQNNYQPYGGRGDFLAGVTVRTQQLWEQVKELMVSERERGILDTDTQLPTGITAHAPGYIAQELEQIVGLQTDKPLKRAIMPLGGIRVVKKSLEAYDYELAPETLEIFTKYRKTHNDGVFDAYTEEMRRARHAGIITGLPDAYGRGRIIGDYRRVALYGCERLITDKRQQLKSLELDTLDEAVIQQREEISEQIRALKELQHMAAAYGCDISQPAINAQEAVQWTYFGYLGAIKEQNGAAMSLGRVSTFLDIYIQRDFEQGRLSEAEAQELIDQFVMKLRMVRFLRTPEYNQLFSGDPVWVTESIGGMGLDGRSLVTQTSFRFLQTLYNLGAAPEPNLTVLWAEGLPTPFKQFCAKVSKDTSSIQYENDDLMRPEYGDDYGIACCVSAMPIGKQMQFFGARVNLAKALLYAINGGRDEKSGEQIAPVSAAIASEILDYDEVVAKFDQTMAWLAKLYVNTLNVIHYMHDKYCYERLEMALHDRDVYRTMACGIAGLSVVADALSAIKYTQVKVVRDSSGLAVDYEVQGDYPAFGNNDERVDAIASQLIQQFMEHIRQNKTYRNAVPTQSILTITSNVVYGKKTGSTPDGRKAGEPFAPGANPMHGRDTKGAIAACESVAQLPYAHAQDGISYTFSIVPEALGKSEIDQVNNLVGLLDGYFHNTGQHININVLNRETLLDAMDHPEKYPQLTIRVSGYAVNFIKLTREQQMDVVNRTFHSRF